MAGARNRPVAWRYLTGTWRYLASNRRSTMRLIITLQAVSVLAVPLTVPHLRPEMEAMLAATAALIGTGSALAWIARSFGSEDGEKSARRVRRSVSLSTSIDELLPSAQFVLISAYALPRLLGPGWPGSTVPLAESWLVPVCLGISEAIYVAWAFDPVVRKAMTTGPAPTDSPK